LPTAGSPSIAVVIPCYRVRDRVLGVIDRIGADVRLILVVDDACPDRSGAHVAANCRDPRVRVIHNERNLGVGGAVTRGYRAALQAGAQIVVKIDGDGQMDPALLPRIVAPITARKADYAKGNRFFSPEDLHGMPKLRLLGNAILSFVSKLSSGYWDVMDPTNGYTAIHAVALRNLPLQKLDARYFFESDMLFRLGTLRAVVRDVPMAAQYADERSGLRIRKVALQFPFKYLSRFFKRIGYLYFVRDFNVGSVELLAGLLALGFGAVYGGYHWLNALSEGPAPTGVIMLAALPVIIGFQLLLAAVGFDVANVPRVPLQELYPETDAAGGRSA
jgi:glycosyltransferase involved in cell wall biosynthesis